MKKNFKIGFFFITTIFIIEIGHTQSISGVGVQFTSDFYSQSSLKDEFEMSHSIGVITSIHLNSNISLLVGINHTGIDVGKGPYGDCSTPPIAFNDVQLVYTTFNTGLILQANSHNSIRPNLSLSAVHMFQSGRRIDHEGESEFRQEYDERIRPGYQLGIIPAVGIAYTINKSVSINLDLVFRKYLYSGEFNYPVSIGYGWIVMYKL